MRAISNPRNPYDSQHRELLEPPSRATVMVYEDQTREILSRNESPDLPFRWSVNPYRGCFHACAYCFAASRRNGIAGTPITICFCCFYFRSWPGLSPPNA